MNQKNLTKQIVEKSKKQVKKNPDNKMIPSGSTIFDLVGGGGFPVGKIINIVGDKSTGKTLLSIEAIAAAKRLLGKKLKWFYDDAECGFNFPTKQMYGFDVVAPDDQCSYTIEDFSRQVDKQLNKLKEEENLIYVLDSLDSLTSNAEIKRREKKEKANEKGKDSKGSFKLEKQKEFSEFFRVMRRKIKTKNCLLIIISQVRTNIGVMFGAKYVRTGGKALDFYASQIYWLAEIEKHYREKRVVGITIKIKNTKNKVGKPFRETFVEILFDYGVDDLTSNIDFLYDLKTELGKSKKKEMIKWDGIEYNIRQLVRYIEKNNLEKELKQRVIDKWNEIEERISTNRKSKWEG